MQIILHTGAHFTEDDRLMKCLLRNQDDFARRGIAVPGPGKYRKLLKAALNAMREAPPAPDAREVLLDAILDEAPAERVILSNAHFFGAPRAALRDGLLYPNAPERIAQMRQLFPDDDLQVFMALRNPATLLPAIYRESPRDAPEDFLEGAPPQAFRWSDTVRAIRAAAPDVPLTLWCHEDAPLIWGQIIRDLAGLPTGTRIAGAFDLLADIITGEGMRRFRDYLKRHPDLNELQRRRVIAAFLDKFAIEEALVEELDMPGWSEPLVEALTALYDADAVAIQDMQGVRLIAP